MKKLLFMAVMFLGLGGAASAIDAPHSDGNVMTCESCHYCSPQSPFWGGDWSNSTNIDDTPYNRICTQCHTNDLGGGYFPGSAPYEKTHSSRSMGGPSSGPDAWTVECRVCHHPHQQTQYLYYRRTNPNLVILAQGTINSISYDSATNRTTFGYTLTSTKAEWTDPSKWPAKTGNSERGLIMYPDITVPTYNYEVVAANDSTITVSGNPTAVSYFAANDKFALAYGQMVREQIEVPVGSDTYKKVKFLDKIGDGSFTGVSTANPINGICQVCHTDSEHTHWRADGTGADHHNNTNCTTCHWHENGFAHGGAEGGAGCITCHGHDAGYEYSPGQFSQGKGTFKSHSTHTENDADDKKGPNIGCGECHDTDVFPKFKDGATSLSATTVCNSCHSEGGDYKGVTDGVIGAKANWKSGVYEADSKTLQPSKEKWCAGCHDGGTSQISGVNAPNVIGYENGTYTYGTGWGYYKTGHGLTVNEKYPSSGETVSGAGISCDYCHDPGMKHIDADARTYSALAADGSENDYRHGYRLISVNGELPMDIPRIDGCESGVMASDFRLCFSCHDSEPFVGDGNMNTNFRDADTNAHYYHLAVQDSCGAGPMADTDWNGSIDSRATCTTCHNVHGSGQLAMVRDGKLVNKVPGLEIAYYNNTVSWVCGGPSPYDPTPADVTLPESTGAVYNSPDAGGICSTCHNSCGWDTVYYRNVPPRIVSVQGQVGSNQLTVTFSEGVYANNDKTGNLVSTDFAFVDTDNGRTIDSVSHVAGNNTAILYLNSPLDSSGDIGTDTLAASSGSSIYNDDVPGTPMGTEQIIVSGIPGGDDVPPEVSNQSPVNGASSVKVYSMLTFTLTDNGSGVDWSTFSIRLEGDKGYSKVYTDADFQTVTKTGSPWAYQVTITPDVYFGGEELITVTLNVSDLNGNALVPPTWSFTTAATPAPTTITLHPSGLASIPSGHTWSTVGGDWSTILDSNDGTSSYAISETGSTFHTFYVDMDTTGLSDVKIQSLQFTIVARFISGYSPSLPGCSGTLDIGYKTGTGVKWETGFSGSGTLFAVYTSGDYTLNSDGGALDLADIENLQIAARRANTGSCRLAVTEVSIKVIYLP